MCDYLDIGNPAYEPEYECSECGEPMNKPGVCSGTCHEASMIQLVKLKLGRQKCLPFFIIFTLYKKPF